MDDRKVHLDALQEQFRSARAEITARSFSQRVLILANITTIGSLYGSLLSKGVDPGYKILIILPIVTSLIGLLYVDHMAAIDKIALFVRGELMPEVDRIVGSQVPDYERYLRRNPPGFFERNLLNGPLFLLFIAVPLSTSVFVLHVLRHAHLSALLFASCIVGIALTAALIPIYFYNIDFKRFRVADAQAVSPTEPRSSADGVSPILRGCFGNVRALVDWRRAYEERWPVVLETITDREALNALYTPWYIDDAGAELAFDDAGARPNTVGELRWKSEGLPGARRRVIEAYADRLSIGCPAVDLTLPAYAVGGGRLLLDGNHRAVALSTVGVPFKLSLVVIKGPGDRGALPDLRHYLSPLGTWVL